MTGSVATGGELDALARVHADAAAFYRAQLHAAGPDAAAARTLLQARAVPPPAIEAYGLGFAPPGWTGLTRHLRALGHPDQLLLDAGVSLRSRHGAVVDRFRDRVMFPVHHPSGSHLIAFLGRLVPDAPAPVPAATPSSSAHPLIQSAGGPQAPGGAADGAAAGQPPVGEAAPKYLNSPQTASYCKGEVLYGLGTGPARQALAAGAVPVLVEGPLDAIAVTWSQLDPSSNPTGSPHADLPQHVGPRYVGVAPCGTALTAAQVAVLQTHTGLLAGRGVGTAFDHDPAGAHAALRAFELLRATGAWPTMAELPPGLDPADVTARHGPAALAAALRTAGPLADLVVDAQLEQWTDRLRWAEGRIGATRAAAHLLATFPAEHVGRQVSRVARRLGLPHSELTTALLEAISPDGPQTPPHPARAPARAPAACDDRPASNAARLAGASYPNALPARTGRSGPGPPGRRGPPSTETAPTAALSTTPAMFTASRRNPLPAATSTDRAKGREMHR